MLTGLNHYFVTLGQIFSSYLKLKILHRLTCSGDEQCLACGGGGMTTCDDKEPTVSPTTRDETNVVPDSAKPTIKPTQ